LLEGFGFAESKACDPTLTVAAQCLSFTDFGAFDLNF